MRARPVRARVTSFLNPPQAGPLEQLPRVDATFLVAAPVLVRAPRGRTPRAWQGARLLEASAGGALAGVAASLLVALLPLPAPGVEGAAGLARSLLWFAGAGGLAGAVLGGLLAVGRGRAAHVAAQGTLAAVWGLWVGGVGALATAFIAYLAWSVLDARAAHDSVPLGTVALPPVVWVAAAIVWACWLGLLLPLAPGRPGGRPGAGAILGGLAGLVGGVATVATGFGAPGLLLLGAALGAASRTSGP